MLRSLTPQPFALGEVSAARSNFVVGQQHIAFLSDERLTRWLYRFKQEFASKWQFLPFIEKGLANYVRVDICNVGGFTEAIKVAGWAKAHYVDLMPHNPLGPVCTAACVHLGAAVPNFAWMEVRALQP